MTNDITLCYQLSGRAACGSGHLAVHLLITYVSSHAMFCSV